MLRAIVLGVMWLGLALGVAASGGPDRTSGASFPLAEGAGVIRSLDYGKQSMVVSGYRYRVATDVEVEVSGSYGAFTMLQPGMRIYFEYLLVSPTERWMVTVRELPVGVSLDET